MGDLQSIIGILSHTRDPSALELQSHLPGQASPVDTTLIPASVLSSFFTQPHCMVFPKTAAWLSIAQHEWPSLSWQLRMHETSNRYASIQGP